MRRFLGKHYLLYFYSLLITILLLVVSNISNFEYRFTRSIAVWDIDKTCTVGGEAECFIYQNSSPRVTVMLIGDSHMQQYFQEFRKIGREENINFVYVVNFSDALIRKIKPAIIIVSNYHASVVAKELSLFESKLSHISSQNISLIYIADNPVFTDYMKYKHYMNPSMFSQFIEIVGFNLRPEKVIDINQINQNSLSASWEYLKVAEKMATIVDPFNIFCTTSNCRRFQNGRWLYWDDHHLSVDGARLIAVNIRSQLLGLIENLYN